MVVVVKMKEKKLMTRRYCDYHGCTEFVVNGGYTWCRKHLLEIGVRPHD